MTKLGTRANTEAYYVSNTPESGVARELARRGEEWGNLENKRALEHALETGERYICGRHPSNASVSVRPLAQPSRLDMSRFYDGAEVQR